MRSLFLRLSPLISVKKLKITLMRMEITLEVKITLVRVEITLECVF
jgi:hypothetical protein